MTEASTRFSVLILAAGKATRFKSEHTKVLHSLAGRRIGDYVLDAALGAKPDRAYMVIGHEAARVKEELARAGVEFILQREQRGTGDAVMAARPQIEKCPSPGLIALVGDAPLLSAATLQGLAEFHAQSGGAAAILTTRLEKPEGYGRILRGAGGRVRAIVEEKDATPPEKRIREISSGIICFSRLKLLEHLSELTDTNSQKEFLLTDMVRIFNRRRLKVLAYPVANSREVLGVNDRSELAQVEKIIRIRKAERLMLAGVTISDPETVVIDDEVEAGRDTRIEAGSHLLGRTRVGRDCNVGPYALVSDSILADHVMVRPFSWVTGSEVGLGAIIGPFSHLHDGVVVGPLTRIGNFVEVKKSQIGRETKALHLSYLGDAKIGDRVNVGAGTVTCNYDGERKNPTVMEDNVFIGSGSMLVAPIRIGEGSYVAAGSALTEDVPPDSLAIARANQINKKGWAKDRRKAQADQQAGGVAPSSPKQQS
ncbi:MAG: bifunctional UDP-N-acetylglucosamine diphosphorylase/glucosamine-1-phosphate N-acetyltransferase GlmU [Acidobacteriota bacterium]|nr:bifunctional UDP-N-acetylglucosamine diphosphorylase/glucosamine-1-phosphate N-acetyltransferase GlmU [Acidobacteriota bacterium]